MRMLLTAGLWLALASGAWAGCAVAPNSASSQLLVDINAFRASYGMKPLSADRRLAAAARDHACDMAGHDMFSHIGTDGSGIKVRAKRRGYRGCTYSEILAWGYRAPERALAGWKHSPPHRSILLDPSLSDFGSALATGSKPYWSVALGARCN